jgi:SPP1 family predicted phage head-tail adaptor
MSGEFAGLLRERVVIERPAGEWSPQGSRTSCWEEVARCLASVTPEGAGAQSEAMALSAMPRFQVLIRTREDIAIDQRLRWRGRLLAFRQIVEDPRQRDRQLLRCEETRG